LTNVAKGLFFAKKAKGLVDQGKKFIRVTLSCRRGRRAQLKLLAAQDVMWLNASLLSSIFYLTLQFRFMSELKRQLTGTEIL
jgi:hypothetical protein